MDKHHIDILVNDAEWARIKMIAASKQQNLREYITALLKAEVEREFGREERPQ